MILRTHAAALGAAFILFVPSFANAQTSDVPKACVQSDQFKLQPIASTHQVPPYPPVSQILGEEGTTLLRVTIGTDGVVRDAMVEKSSGSLRLDDAALSYVKTNWHWAPLPPTCPAASTLVSIVWNLRSPPSPPAAILGPEIAALARMLIPVPVDSADYPPESAANKERGVTFLMVSQIPPGKPRIVVLRGSGSASLDAKAVEIAGARYRWTPAQMDGKPVAACSSSRCSGFFRERVARPRTSCAPCWSLSYRPSPAPLLPRRRPRRGSEPHIPLTAARASFPRYATRRSPN